MQRLVHVAHEVHDILQGLGLRRAACRWVSQAGEKLLNLADHAIAAGAFPLEVNS